MTRQVLTINVMVPCAAGLIPAAQPWLLWIVYSVFTSHVDIAFHTTVRPPYNNNLCAVAAVSTSRRGTVDLANLDLFGVGLCVLMVCSDGTF